MSTGSCELRTFVEARIADLDRRVDAQRAAMQQAFNTSVTAGHVDVIRKLQGERAALVKTLNAFDRGGE